MITTKPLILREYMNGNCHVELYADGSKHRSWDGKAQPEVPESIDLKITDYCDAGCSYCHEKSTRKGQHADIEVIKGILAGLPAGVEIAIGGGNPMSHPSLGQLLQWIAEQDLIANLTINKEHACGSSQQVLNWQSQGLLHGVGLSVDRLRGMEFLDFWPANLVYHVIVGVADPQRIILDSRPDDKILVLGFKRYGFGLSHNESKVVKEINRWRYWIKPMLKRCRSVSFDNLAIKQLGIKSIVKPEVWASRYMGDDGQFTMYVDAVRNEYAVSSTSIRKSCESLNIREMFADVRQTARRSLEIV